MASFALDGPLNGNYFSVLTALLELILQTIVIILGITSKHKYFSYR
jgi:hypothetical protein